MGFTSHLSAKPTRISWRLWVPLGCIVVLLVWAGVLGFQILHTEQKLIPETTTRQLNFAAYAPQALPGVYRLASNSFAVSKDNGVSLLVFKASDTTGDTITFTEQSKPNGFDFSAFYQNQLTDPKTLNQVPYPSVWGKDKLQQQTTLSIVTDSTWILVTTKAPIDEQGLLRIAQSLQRQ